MNTPHRSHLKLQWNHNAVRGERRGEEGRGGEGGEGRGVERRGGEGRGGKGGEERGGEGGEGRERGSSWSGMHERWRLKQGALLNTIHLRIVRTYIHHQSL